MSGLTVIDQYLTRYAEPESAVLEQLHAWMPEELIWSDVVVIPACNESGEFLSSQPVSCGPALMIVVINQTPSARSDVAAANQHLLEMIGNRFELCWSSADSCPKTQGPGFGLHLFDDESADRHILVVDKFSEGNQLPPKGGVGNARKIGADLAAALIHMKRISSSWIRCTDADVQIPDSYFACTAEYDDSSDIAALIYPFQHGALEGREGQADVLLATALYELSLRYYVAAMQAARSPYAFHTIGSTIAIHVDHYARVRGFPKREAGEDFYLLNKLAKSGRVVQMKPGSGCRPIQIEARLSDRVPFGTGAAVNKMTALDNVVEDYRFYDPRLFQLLGLWLDSWSNIWASENPVLSPQVFGHTIEMGAHGGQVSQAEIHSLIGALAELKTEVALQHAFKQSKTFDQFARHLHTWFDAFRSLKLMHALRDQLWPSIKIRELSQNPAFVYLLDQDTDLRECYEKLDWDD